MQRTDSITRSIIRFKNSVRWSNRVLKKHLRLHNNTLCKVLATYACNILLKVVHSYLVSFRSLEVEMRIAHWKPGCSSMVASFLKAFHFKVVRSSCEPFSARQLSTWRLFFMEFLSSCLHRFNIYIIHTHLRQFSQFDPQTHFTTHNATNAVNMGIYSGNFQDYNTTVYINEAWYYKGLNHLIQAGWTCKWAKIHNSQLWDCCKWKTPTLFSRREKSLC